MTTPSPISAFWAEPDHFFSNSHGLPTVALRNHAKAWCGYVGVPSSHPLFGANFSDRITVPDRAAIDISAASPILLFLEAMEAADDKCSLAIASEVHGGLTYSNEAWWDEADPHWYFGFDCGHLFDLTPQQVFNDWLPDDTTYRTLPFVKTELTKLAKFLSSQTDSQ